MTPLFCFSPPSVVTNDFVDLSKYIPRENVVQARALGVVVAGKVRGKGQATSSRNVVTQSTDAEFFEQNKNFRTTPTFWNNISRYRSAFNIYNPTVIRLHLKSDIPFPKSNRNYKVKRTQVNRRYQIPN
jgi:hypothetical protein